MKRRYLMCCVGRGTGQKIEQIVHATGKRDAYSIWLRRHKTINFIEDCGGSVDLTAERILTEQEVEAREKAILVDPDAAEPA